MILVTGANGLLGSKVCQHLSETGHEVLALVREQSNLKLLQPCIDKIKIIHGDVMSPEDFETELNGIDTIIHTAAIVSFHQSDKEDMMKINVEGTANMINLALRNNSKYFIHISSVAALGRNKKTDIVDENGKWEESELNSNYGYSKYLAELEVYRGIAEGLKAVILNPSVILSNAKSSRSSGSVIRYIMKEPAFYPKGKLNYVDVRDVLEVISICLERKPSGERFVLNGGIVAYKDFFLKVTSILNLKHPKYEAGPKLAYVGMWLQRFASIFSNKRPIITPETIRLSKTDIYFSNEKAKKELGINFASLTDTLNWVLNKR